MLKAFLMTCICFHAWVELDSKQNVDQMWESWKTLFLKVLDKHAPKRSKRIRKKGNVPWFNKTVKNKLFQRDRFKTRCDKNQ